MVDAMEEAARAFDAEMGRSQPAPTARRTTPKEDAGGPPERLFGNIGQLEVDDESPAKGGGDDDYEEAVIYEEEPPKRKPSKEGDDEPGEGTDDVEDDEEGVDEVEEEKDPDEEEFLGQSVQVMVDGEEKTVKLKEALDGYIRTETFHKRMNEVDEARKIVQRAAADAVQNYEYSANLGKQIEAHLEALVPKEPNWDEEFAKNPARARELQKYYEQVRGFREKLRKDLDEAAKKRADSDRVQLETFVDEETRKFDQKNIKNWATDPKKKAKDLQAMRRTALGEGFTEDEISKVYDSRMLMVLLKASKFDRIMASRPKPVQSVRAKPVAPGTGSARQRTVHRGVSSAMKRLNKSGSVEDAAVVMDEIIRRGG